MPRLCLSTVVNSLPTIMMLACIAVRNNPQITHVLRRVVAGINLGIFAGIALNYLGGNAI